MRARYQPQLQIGQVSIENIQIDTRSRDDIPKLLKGLQYIYCNKEIREAVFKILEEDIGETRNLKNGRPGLELWKILVMGVLRLNLDLNYDRLREMVNSHREIKQMLGHSNWLDDHRYALQTIKDNVNLFTEKTLIKINEVVVKEGHKLFKKKEIEARCDSFVVETNVHFPTDINLLWDACRKVIKLTATLCRHYAFSDWRQFRYNLKKIKTAYLLAQRSKKSKAKNSKEQVIIRHREYISLCQSHIEKARNTLVLLKEKQVPHQSISEIESFIDHAQRQMMQIQKRVLEGEMIPSSEKVYSLFEPHTEWLSKGKAGVLVELGLNVCVLEDKNGFILNHRVMKSVTDKEIAVSFISETKERYPYLIQCSLDRGFYSAANEQELGSILDAIVMPKPGKRSQERKSLEQEPLFVKARKQHSAVESGIHALQAHGLDRCPDKGEKRFRRYVAMGVLGHNIQKIGVLLLEREREKAQKNIKQKLAA